MNNVQNHIHILFIITEIDETSGFCGIGGQQRKRLPCQRVKALQLRSANCCDLFTQGTISDSAVFTRNSHRDVCVPKKNKTRH
jgi:hypothetical protein